MATQPTLNARAAWDEGMLTDFFRSDIEQVIVTEDSISLDWPVIDGHKTSTTLNRKDGFKLSGRSVWAAGSPKQQEADVEAYLYSNKLGHVIVGEEKWSSGRVDWFVVQVTLE